ncbi:MAG TPA: hypothetical protein VD905_15365, partial [Flavobacteriales bacterium]|nr:hypothetical protein [Flavobacteriales bacterium]
MHSNSPDISSRNAKERQHDGLGDISIWLDSYNDIFSDFDPRPYSQRTLSDDFLTQVRKVSHESEEKVNKLKLLLPADKREDKKEAVIAKRIHQHFKKHLHEHKKKYGATIRKGIFFTVGGMLLMLVASYISASQSQAFLKHM